MQIHVCFCKEKSLRCISNYQRWLSLGIIGQFPDLFYTFLFQQNFLGNKKQRQGKPDQGLSPNFPVRGGKWRSILLPTGTTRLCRIMHSIIQVTTFAGKWTRGNALHANIQFVDGYISCSFSSPLQEQRSLAGPHT